ncbi:enamine deaminase RidA (YjgF/YER057c/UK114 family) [Dysgonomonadaceae bacterium PH5-43]|nr:enamine deaminase RidA (YjgF/YER057c/UK114 family) [Dysgonomonadaceae bacterium PH5-43]
MRYIRKEYREKNTLAEISVLEKVENVKEYNVIIKITNSKLTLNEQLLSLFNTCDILSKEELNGASPVFKRYFLSDIANQSELLQSMITNPKECAVSMVEQPPLNGTKVALWAYFQSDIEKAQWESNLFQVKHKNSPYTHLWGGSAFNKAANSEYQTRLIFNDYIMQLTNNNCTLAENCIRTWLFVQNVDVNYAGVVKARNEVFVTQNLTDKTHFISSTGIAGRNADPKVFVQMDTYAVKGISQQQVQYLYAPTHLNPTHEYGVSFERGTCVKYDDRRHVFISGTASIDNKGQIVHVGDIRKQTERMWENVEVLLAEAECSYQDVAHLIVYLRDVADYDTVKELFDNKFPDIPKVLVLAPVCRPGWLIEMECIAIKCN